MHAVDVDSDVEFVLGSDDDNFVDIAKALRNNNPTQFRAETRDLEAEELFNCGYTQTLDEAINVVKMRYKHRDTLGWCRETSAKYVQQLTDLEFKGFFRMSRNKFEEVLAAIRFYYEDRNPLNTRGKEHVPLRYLLTGTLRWLAGGSPHDIIFFCGLRLRSFQRLRWRILDSIAQRPSCSWTQW
jgi:hypothetical protein